MGCAQIFGTFLFIFTENTVFEFPVTHHYMNKKANAAAIFKVHHDDFLAQIQLDAYRVYSKFL